MSIELNPEYIDAYSNLGTFLLAYGEREEAIKQFSITEDAINDLEKPFNFTYAYRDIGRAALSVNDWELGEKYLLKGSEHPKGLIPCYGLMIHYLILKGRFGEVIETSNAFVSRGDRTDEILGELDDILENTTMTVDMIAYMENYMKTCSEDERVKCVLLMKGITGSLR